MKDKERYDIRSDQGSSGGHRPSRSEVSGGTLQYKFYCQLPMGAFQRQILIVQAIKTNKQTKNTQELSINNY